MQKVKEDVWEKLTKKTIHELLNQYDLYIYSEAETSYIFNWKKIDKEKIREEIKKINYPEEDYGFLRYIYIVEDNEYYGIDEKIREKLEERLYYATKDINNDFEGIPKPEVTKFLLDLADEMTEVIDRKIEEKSKKYVMNLL